MYVLTFHIRQQTSLSNLIWCMTTTTSTSTSTTTNLVCILFKSFQIAVCPSSFYAELSSYLPTIYQSSYLLCHCVTCTMLAALSRLTAPEWVGAFYIQFVMSGTRGKRSSSSSFRFRELQFYYVECRASIWFTSLSQKSVSCVPCVWAFSSTCFDGTVVGHVQLEG